MPSLPALLLPCVSVLPPHFQLVFPHRAMPHLTQTQNATFLITLTINTDRILLLLFWLVQIKSWLPHPPPVLSVAQLQLSPTVECRTEHEPIGTASPLPVWVKGVCLQTEEAAKALWSCIYYFLHWFRKVLELLVMLKHTEFSLRVFAAGVYLLITVIKSDLHFKRGQSFKGY